MEASISLSTLPVFASFHLEKSEVKSCKKLKGLTHFGREVVTRVLGGFCYLGLVFTGFQDVTQGCGFGRLEFWKDGLPCAPSQCASSDHFQF